MRGVKKPNALKVLEGDFDKNPQRRREVLPTVGKPPKPPELTAEASDLWDRVVVYPWIGESDGVQLQTLCEAWQLLRHSMRAALADPLDKNSRCAVTAHIEKFTKLAAAFGLTPLDREKLTPGDKKNSAADEKKRFLA